MSSSTHPSKETVPERAKAATAHIRDSAADAYRSRAYLYPLLGIAHVATHRALWRPLARVVLPAAALSLGVLTVMFAVVYVPQAAVMCLVQMGPWGVVSAIGLTLTESAVIINSLARAFILEERVTEVFDAVLVERGAGGLAERGRQITPSKGGKVKKLGKVVMKPLNRFSPGALAYYLMTLPLQFIPVAGAAIFFLLNGAKVGPSLHSRYFQLKQFNPEQKASFIHARRGAYTAMGTTSLLLSTIPFVSILFTFTSAAGAALFAADIERGVEKPDVPLEAVGRDIARGANGETEEGDVAVEIDEDSIEHGKKAE